MQRIEIQIIFYISIRCFYVPAQMVQFLDLLKREFTFIQICCDALISVIIDLEADNPEAKLKTVISSKYSNRWFFGTNL